MASKLHRLLLPILLAGVASWLHADHDPPPLADPIPGAIPVGPFTVRLQDVVSNLVFPVDVAAPPDGSSRLFVTLRQGKVLVIRNGAVLPAPFLDISATTVLDAGSAMSSVAFHPGFADPASPGWRKLYTVSQEAAGSGVADFPDGPTVAHQNVIYEWRASLANPDLVDPASRREVLRIDSQATVHNVDELVFGPLDGYLYVSKGDDDAGAEVLLDGRTIHGSILRIDVDGTSHAGRYGVPPDNPFVAPGDDRIDEIWAHGFRNPWEMAFDRNSARLYVGDIGEDDLEEVDRIEPGRYYGWNDKEGSFAFLDFNGVTDDLGDLPPGFAGVDPIGEYDHTEGDRSITGGFVYRGSQLLGLRGHYVFGDYVSGRLMHLEPNSGRIQLLSIDPTGAPLTPGIIGIGEDEAGELLLVITRENFTLSGRVVRLVGLTAQPPAPPPPVPATSLRVAKLDPDGHTLAVSWDTVTCPEARGYHLLFGWGSQLPTASGAAFDLAGGACDLGITSPWTWGGVPDPGSDPSRLLWWVVVAHDGEGREGSWGEDGAGGERLGPGPGGSSGLCGIVSRSLASTCGP